jgi:pimeloyl-ACP methyl ester carboxylesterase
MLNVLRRVPFLRGFLPQEYERSHHIVRRSTSEAAIVFIHGFTGAGDSTWGSMIDFIKEESLIASWDILTIEYPTALRMDIPNVWSSDPDLDILALTLRTSLSQPPFAQYKQLALVAHSMGGLVAQKAIVDNEQLSRRISQLVLYATPSNGVEKARPFLRLKKQIRDMVPDSDFIVALRARWTQKFGDRPPFELRIIAGNKDDFVPASSSISPFLAEFVDVVSGDHLGIIRPQCADDPSVQVLVGALRGLPIVASFVDSAEIALELGEFQRVVDALLPSAAVIDDAAIIDLAMALDGLNRGDEALAILTERHGAGNLKLSDALATFGGRLKRRWLVGRLDRDLKSARQLYQDALSLANEQGNDAQAAYHLVNLAFLEIMATAPDTAVPERAKDLARSANERATRVNPMTNWMLATQGECSLVLGDLDEGLRFYSEALRITQSPRQIASMFSQAARIATRAFGKDGAKRLEKVFGYTTQHS